MEEKEITAQFDTDVEQSIENGAVSAPPKKRDGKTRIITGTVMFLAFAAIIVSSIAVNFNFLLIVMFILIFIGTWEITAAFKAHMTLPQRVVSLTYAAGLFVPFCFFGNRSDVWYGFAGVFYYILLFFIISAFTMLFDKKVTLTGIAATVMSFVYPGLLMLAMAALTVRLEGIWLFILLFVTVSFTDIFAYTVGSLFGKGKRKLCPDISPNKTVIGAIGGLLGGLTGSLIVFIALEVLKHNVWAYDLFSGNFKWLHIILTGVFMSVFTQAGDLTASLIKRKTGIKDYGKIFPGHGGVLDRFDGMMFAAVFLMFYVTVVF